jgi:hypothetical protein
MKIHNEKIKKRQVIMKMKKIRNYLSCHSLGRNENSQRGAALVEFAIIIPLLLVIVFGIIEFGLILYNKQVITNASREGARAGIVAKNPRMTADEIKNIVLNYAEDHLINFGDKLVLGDITVTPNSTSGAEFEDELKCEVDFEYNFLVLGTLLPSKLETIDLNATTVMIYE